MGKSIAALLSLICCVVLAQAAPDRQFKIGENLRHERVFLPLEVPDRARLALIDNVMYLDEEGAAGILIYYDDPRTRWEIDYIEFFDVTGELLLVGWVDRIGICHVAMDRGLLDIGNPTVDGTLVIINVGRLL